MFKNTLAIADNACSNSAPGANGNRFKQRRTSTMRRKVLTAAAVAVMLLVATRLGTALAQDAFKAGPEHQAMEPLAGTFNAKIEVWEEPGKQPSESEGVMVRKWIMGGRFLQEDFDGKFNGASFKG